MFFNLSMLMDRLRIGGVELIREHDGELRLTRVAMVAENASPRQMPQSLFRQNESPSWKNLTKR